MNEHLACQNLKAQITTCDHHAVCDHQDLIKIVHTLLIL